MEVSVWWEMRRTLRKDGRADCSCESSCNQCQDQRRSERSQRTHLVDLNGREHSLEHGAHELELRFGGLSWCGVEVAEDEERRGSEGLQTRGVSDVLALGRRQIPKQQPAKTATVSKRS